MASPLNWFRRNAIWIMVPVGIFCMAFFGLGAVFDTLTSTARTGTRENPTIATYNGGQYTRDQLNGLIYNHYQTREFLSALRDQGVEERGDQFVDLVRPIAPIQDGAQELIDEQIIGRELMAKKAEAEGITVSDGMIDQYLFGTYGVIDGGGLSNRDMELLNREVNRGQISMAAIRRHLRTELLNQQMTMLSFAGIPRVPNPSESIEHYSKVSNRTECEIFPVSISQYVDNSVSPSEAEIRELYNQGKFDFKDPSGKRAGFKMARRIKLQYFVGDYQDFLDEASKSLSDEEIQTKYDELVAQESDLVMEIVIDEDGASDDLPTINLEGAQNADATSDENEEEAAPKPTGSPDDASDEPADKDQSYNVGESNAKFVLVSMPVQEDKKIAAVAPSDEPEVSQEAPTEENTLQDEDSDEAADLGSIADMKDIDVGPMLTDDDGPTKRAKPLTEVANVIHLQLKGSEASEALNKAIKTAESEIENYLTKRLQWEVQGKEKNLPAPELPDFQSIAERNGLRFAETELVDNEGLLKTELGGVYETFRIQNRQVPVPLADLIFDRYNNLTEYSSASTTNRFTGKSYVYWPTELADSKVPKLEECKDQIIEFWRQRQAIEAAKKAAQEIASKVGKDKKLSEFDSARTIQTGEFTWFQPRGQRAVLSSPIGVESPSEDFMETAFSLDQGEAGIAVNGSGDTIFVIQSQAPKASVAETGDDFLKNQLFRFQRLPPDVGLVNGHYLQEKTRDWNQEFVDSMGFELMK